MVHGVSERLEYGQRLWRDWRPAEAWRSNGRNGSRGPAREKVALLPVRFPIEISGKQSGFNLDLKSLISMVGRTRARTLDPLITSNRIYLSHAL
jgi:hypothetical protein